MFPVTHVIMGAAPGVDTLAGRFATNHGLDLTVVPAQWNAKDAFGERLGKRAGPLRNLQMLAMADALIALPGTSSKGTWNIISQAEAARMRIYWERVFEPFHWEDDGKSLIDPRTLARIEREKQRKAGALYEGGRL